MKFIYPGNLKEPKTFLFLRVFDLAVTGILLIICIVYTFQVVKKFNINTLIFPFTFLILKIRILEDGSNIWEKLLDAFSYLVLSQQTYFWEVKK